MESTRITSSYRVCLVVQVLRRCCEASMAFASHSLMAAASSLHFPVIFHS